MKRLFVPTQTGSDWQRLLGQPGLQWKKGRSAMAAAASWESAGNAMPSEIAKLLDSSLEGDLADLELLAAFPEWETELEGGHRPSQTDVLALAHNPRGLCVVAVEAKVNEDFGPLVSAKRLEASAGQQNRLDFLQDQLHLEQIDDGLRYQLLHRTVSAILTARDFHAHAAVMVVQSFGSKESVREDFDRFCRALKAQTLPGGLATVPSFAQPRLFLGWCKGDSRFLDVELPGTLEPAA